MLGYTISAEQDKLDIELIYSFISTSYWASGITKAIVEKSIRNSLCFGVFKQHNEQVGFARVITDRATFAYLADVFIVKHCRGQGLGKWLMDTIMNSEDLQGLRRFLLATKDAHSLYAQYGFSSIDQPGSLMQIWNPDVYQASSS